MSAADPVITLRVSSFDVWARCSRQLLSRNRGCDLVGDECPGYGRLYPRQCRWEASTGWGFAWRRKLRRFEGRCSTWRSCMCGLRMGRVTNGSAGC
jgi:hypothetical protein